MVESTIALQTWTLRHYLKSEENIGEVLRQVKSIGYEHLELGGVGRLSPPEFAALLSQHKLDVIGLHEPSLSSSGLNALLIEIRTRCRIFNTNCVVVSWDSMRARTTKAYSEYARLCTKAAQVLRGDRISLCFHCFDFDLGSPTDGYPDTPALDILMDETSADDLSLQFDTFFIERARCNLRSLLSKYGRRCRCVHVDDIDLHDRYAPLGKGRIPWPETIRAFLDWCPIEYFVVEHETDKPLEWIRDSYDFWATKLSHIVRLRDHQDGEKVS